MSVRTGSSGGVLHRRANSQPQVFESTDPSVTRRFTKKRIWAWFVLSALTVVAIVWILPFVYMVDVSFRLPQDVFNPALIVSHFTLANWQTVIDGNA